jgi:predicted DNA-binding transcriptional regulator YafY
MRRADRLFQILQFVRSRGVTTAAALADALEVSERTIYRDIRDLMLSGVPLDGEAGVGYRLRKGFDLPPLMFTSTELEALVLGARLVSSWADAELAKAAGSAMARIEAVLPEGLRSRLNSRLYAPGFHVPRQVIECMGTFRIAADEQRKVWLAYRDVDSAVTERVVRPLGLTFWGSTWSVTAWCELREDFRNFRLDRVVETSTLAERFEQEPGKTLEDFFHAMDLEEPRGHGGR